MVTGSRYWKPVPELRIEFIALADFVTRSEHESGVSTGGSHVDFGAWLILVL